MLALLDWLLTIAHVAVILGFMVLWIPRRTVLLHRWIVGLTAASWLLLGAFNGIGYCFLTDLHWHVKRARGVRHLPSSFIKYLADFVSGRNVPGAWVNDAAAAVFVGGCLAAVFRLYQARSTRHPG